MLDRNTSPAKLLLISLLGAIFITYPNIACFSWDLHHMAQSQHTSYILLFIFRYVFFVLLIYTVIRYNFRHIGTVLFAKRLSHTTFITGTAYLIYVALSFTTRFKADCFTGLLLFQFFVVSILGTFVGHVSFLYSEKRRKEQEIEQLKIENLQSRYDALTHQIHPHFFFNSLSGLASLIRKRNEEVTLEYLNKLSDGFRYILQSENKGLVKLEEELEFVAAFQYMMEVRFANKLVFHVDVAKEKLGFQIPVLSLLPLMDNVVVHNIIDSEHKMEVTIRLNDQNELVIANPVFQKLTPPTTNGTGLKNLDNRFMLLMNRPVRIENDGKTFRVYLCLK